MQLNLFDTIDNDELSAILLSELFQAYQLCRKNKRHTVNAVVFETNYEQNLIQLWQEINLGTYTPGRSVAFIIEKPVKREIFAADFRDRVVHHLIISKINPYFEKQFIFDSYACRLGKGTHFGIRRADKFIRQCSENYSKDCFILKLDIQGFFMNINRDALFSRLSLFIEQKYVGADMARLIELCRKVIFNDPVRNCIKKSSSKKWAGLPESKSLFHSPDNSGLPIGNLSSQIFANFYLDKFDHFIKHDLQIKYYGRYVDDFIVVHPSKAYLKSLIPEISIFLKNELHLTLHPKKIYLQHYSKGVKFLGTIIKPNRIYIANRTKGNFYQAIQMQNAVVKNHKPSPEERSNFLSSMNAYLGILGHYKTYRLRKKMLWKYLSGYWWNLTNMAGGYAKFVWKKKKIRKPFGF